MRLPLLRRRDEPAGPVTVAATPVLPVFPEPAVGVVARPSTPEHPATPEPSSAPEPSFAPEVSSAPEASPRGPEQSDQVLRTSPGTTEPDRPAPSDPAHSLPGALVPFASPTAPAGAGPGVEPTGDLLDPAQRPAGDAQEPTDGADGDAQGPAAGADLQSGGVALGFADGASLHLAADDPRAATFRDAAAALLEPPSR